MLRLIIDDQSGGYIEASGRAQLEMSYDRTGNLQLAVNYTIKKGVYRLSLYDENDMMGFSIVPTMLILTS